MRWSATALTAGFVAGFAAASGAFGAAAASPADGPELKSYYEGVLDVKVAKLKLGFNFVKGDGGTYAATLDSPDQSAFDIPASKVELDAEGKLTVEVKAIGGLYTGTVSKDGASIEGTWRQGLSYPLNVSAADKKPRARRPQDPEEPFPYRSEEIVVENPEGGVKLAGTLTIPEGTGPFPAVALLTGSGAQDRDESLMGHRPFLVLSDHLARAGVAVARFDDRGVGGSTGNLNLATLEDLAGDALAMVKFLRSRPEIDPSKVGLLGHSEGGLTGPIAASRSADVAFVVMMAGPGVNGERILRSQRKAIAERAGTPAEANKRNEELALKLTAAALEHDDPAEARAAMERVAEEYLKNLTLLERLQKEAIEAQLRGQVAMLSTPAFRFFALHEPVPVLERVKVPVLALLAENDLQVYPPDNADALEGALKKAGNPKSRLVILPGMNHLFQPSTSGVPTEYGEIETTIDPKALKTMSDFIREVVGTAPNGEK